MRQNNVANAILLTCTLIAGGCGSDDMQMSTPTGTGMGGAAGTGTGAGASVGASGSGGGGAPLPASGTGGAGVAPATSTLVDQYAGTWRYVSGTSITVCGGQSATKVLSGTIQVGKGLDADLVRVSEACSIQFDVESGGAMV